MDTVGVDNQSNIEKSWQNRSMASGIEEKIYELHAELSARGVIVPEPVVDGSNHPYCTIDGRAVITFCSNSYLGLGRVQSVKDAAIRALETTSHSTSESRRLGGNFELLGTLEHRLAKFKKKQSCLTTATGLLANITVLHGLADVFGLANRWYGVGETADVLTILDQNAHESLRMGARLSSAELLKFKHNDLADLERLLDKNSMRPTLVATDGVFSMDGDLAPLSELAALCTHYGAMLVVDDAHGTGVYGQDGAGTPDHLGVQDKIPVVVATLSKSLAAMGGAVLASHEVIETLRVFGSGYRFTSALPTEQAMAVIAALDIIENDSGPRDRLWRNVKIFRKGLSDLGLAPIGIGPIVALLAGDARTAKAAENSLFDHGYWCPSVLPPAVHPEECRIRITVTAAHSPNQIFGLLDAIDALPKETKEKMIRLTNQNSHKG